MVSSTNPAAVATGVAINTSISAAFSEAMDASTLTTATFTLSSVAAVTGTVSFIGTTAIFTPSADLEGGTPYTATITTDVKDAAGNALAANYVWSFTTGTLSDTTPPLVSFTSPANGATDVAINAAIVAAFSETMNASTLTPATFMLNSGAGPVTGTVSYSGTTAAFIPSPNLTSNTAYTVTITTGAKDASGNALAANYVWSFTTGATVDATPPLVSFTSPVNGATGVAINTMVSATFNEVMLPSTLTPATFTLSSGAGPVMGTVGYTGTTATFTPSADLTGDTAYTATITTGAKDAAGNALSADYVWSFTTGAAPDILAPSFAGVEQASVLNPMTVGLFWSDATDDVTPVSAIRYLVYIAASSGGYDFGSPHVITDPGVTDYDVIGLSSGQTYYFLVRAVDDAGNADSNTIEKSVALVEWQDPTGSPTPVSLNVNQTQGFSDEPSLAFNGGRIYAAWVEKNGSSASNQTYVGSLSVAPWTVEGSLNVSSAKSAKEATVAFDGADQQYVAWSEHDVTSSGQTTSGDVYVKQKIAGVWVPLGGSLTISGGGLSSIATVGHSPAVIPVTPHIAFKQLDTDGVSQVFVKQWNGATWDLLPGPNPVGSLNVGPAISAGLPVLAYVGTIPYVVWAEGSQGDLYVYRWNGAVWEPVGGKLNSLKTREHAWMTSDGATVYVSWAEEDGSGVYQAYVAQWNGADWVRIGGSLNVDAGKEVHSARVAVATDGTVYSAWAEKDGSSVFQFYARRWDGSSWILEGGSLNVDPGQDVSEPHLAVNGNVPYAAWAESGIVYVKTLP